MTTKKLSRDNGRYVRKRLWRVYIILLHIIIHLNNNNNNNNLGIITYIYIYIFLQYTL